MIFTDEISLHFWHTEREKSGYPPLATRPLHNQIVPVRIGYNGRLALAANVPFVSKCYEVFFEVVPARIFGGATLAQR
jgi:hypothetical protein